MIRHALLLLLFSSAAQGADWARLGQIRGDDQYFYDRSKLVIQGEEITYWKKVVFKTPQPVKNQSATWSLMRERIHCGQHTLRLISYLYYGADGAVIEYVADHEKEGTPIIPDTIGDAFEHQMCELVKAQQQATAKSATPGPQATPAPPATAGTPEPAVAPH